MTKLIRELIDIPTRVHGGDFVLRLTEGVADADRTLKDYVVTEALAKNFDAALAEIRNGVDASSSKASYLHGSFGSGKSHFMAVLDLLLAGNVKARSIPELAPVLADHGAWLEGKRFLLVPYHMLGARSLEAAILGGYSDRVRALHSEAPVPPVFLGERLFADARRQREAYGDEKFFALLNQGKSEGGGKWGSLVTRWDAASFEAAMTGDVRDDARARLISNLVANVFQSYRDVADAGVEGFVSLDDGLSIVSKHAAALGYDAVILFLDELILWLAGKVADMAFVSREAEKLAKLVESTTADRPIPLISFVARQRDLTELVGEHVPGAERLGFSDVLKWSEGRFDVITLEDRNLPTIAEKRILKPVSEEAGLELDQAFADATGGREDVMRVLLTSDADPSMFRQVYPFSPALVQTLIAVSSALQRERTALKVMVQLLVNQRDTLRLKDIVPVGDLFDVIADGDEPFSEAMRRLFESAKKLYHEKLLPIIEREHELRKEDVASLAPDDAKATAFHSDDRLLKTALLAALVPEVESLKGLTAGKLAALNHGTIASPIPGREATMVLAKFRKWASEAGEIKVSEDPLNPTIELQLVGIDTEAVLAKAESVDTAGNRQKLVRKMLFRELGARVDESLIFEHGFLWRGTRRRAEVVYGNIRALPDESIQPAGDGWKVVIDYPFDIETHGAADDQAKLAQFRERHGDTRTLCWVPVFLSREVQRELGVLVRLDYVLKNDDRLRDHTEHLSATERSQARTLLQNRQSQLRERLRAALEVAYGASSVNRELVEASHDLIDCFQSLDSTFRPEPPVGANLQECFQHLLDQVMQHEFPGHPSFTGEVKLGRLRKVRTELERAVQAPDGRIVVEDRALRPEMRDIAQGLKLGTMYEDAFVLDEYWKHNFIRHAGADEGAVTAGKLRRWMDDPKPMGLPSEVANLVVLTFADQTRQSFFLHGGPHAPSLDNLPDAVELREQPLPEQAVWTAAVDRAASLFGEVVSSVLTANVVADLALRLREKAAEHRTAANRLPGVVLRALEQIGANPQDAPRIRTAQAASALVQSLTSETDNNTVVERLAAASFETSAQAMARSLSKAEDVVHAIESTEFVLFKSLIDIDAARRDDAERVLAKVREALSADELAVALEPALREGARAAAKLLAGTKPPGDPDWSIIDSGKRTVCKTKDLDAWREQVIPKLVEGRRLTIRWSIDERKDRT